MASLEDSGTLSANGTEQTLSTVTTTGSFVLLVDLNAMALGDKVVIRVKTKILSGGTTRLAYTGSYSHGQGIPIVASIPVPSDQEAVFTLEQTAGTNRSYPWKVMAL